MEELGSVEWELVELGLVELELVELEYLRRHRSRHYSAIDRTRLVLSS